MPFELFLDPVGADAFAPDQLQAMGLPPARAADGLAVPAVRRPVLPEILLRAGR